MAIAAAYVTFRDLRRDDRNAESIADHLHDGVPLGGIWSVIEIQHSEIRHAAVDAWMRTQIVTDEIPRSEAVSISALSNHADVTFPVVSVVLSGRRAVALSTDLLQAIRACRLPVEIGEWFRLLAGAASFHGRHLPP